MPKLTEYENPITGKRHSIFDIGNMWSLILGGVVLFFVAATSQNVAKAISNKVPMIDTQPERFTTQRVVQVATTKGVL